MLSIKLTTDETVKRLRLVMAAAIILSIALTLAGQPAIFWHHAAAAIRGDGLSINNPTNHTFEFFLGSGWLPFILTSLLYLAGAFLLASVLPRKLALVFIFSVIFGHYFGGSNRLAVRWHMGGYASFFYGVALAAGIAFAAFPANGLREPLKVLRWVMLFAMLTDVAVTLIGQPAGYWHHPQLVDEGNQVSRFFLAQGWYPYIAEQAIICVFMYWLATILPGRWGMALAFCYTFIGFNGASCWFFYRWLWGMQAPVIFGCVLSAAIVLQVFSPKGKAHKVPGLPQESLVVPGLLSKVCRC